MQKNTSDDNGDCHPMDLMKKQDTKLHMDHDNILVKIYAQKKKKTGR